jgi:hypothetical protein
MMPMFIRVTGHLINVAMIERIHHTLNQSDAVLYMQSSETISLHGHEAKAVINAITASVGTVIDCRETKP